MNSSFPYNKVPNTTSFVQPSLASALIGQILNVNKSVLSKIIISENVKAGRHEIEKGATLSSLLEAGIKGQYAAQDFIDVFMKQIGAQKEYVFVTSMAIVAGVIAPIKCEYHFLPSSWLNANSTMGYQRCHFAAF